MNELSLSPVAGRGSLNVAEGIASPVFTRRTNAIVSSAVVRPGARLTRADGSTATAIPTKARPFPNDSHEERRGLEGCLDPRDRDRRLRRLSLSTSLALGQVDASAQITTPSVPLTRPVGSE